MSDDDLGRRLARRLDAGLQDIPPGVLQRLGESRETALARARAVHARGFSLAVPGQRFGHGFRLLPPGRHVLPLAALLVGLAAVYFWHRGAPQEEPDEVELLAGELPPNAYLDEGFDRWLADSTQR